MSVCDVMTNLRFDHKGSAKCHDNLDKVLTPTGDTARVCGEWARLQQHLLHWLATPLGERIDPKLGCVIHKYLLRPLTDANIARLEMELKSNLEYNFPDFLVVSVRCERTVNLDNNAQALAVAIQFNNYSFDLLIDTEEMLQLRQQVKSTLGALENITNARS